ncbi:MAG TPA: hypothetical protein DEA28_01200 [Firmicutes bacterium]|nr:hypothetical protein [Bacillota bacterium]
MSDSVISRNKSREIIFECMYSFLILEACNVSIDFKGIIEIVTDKNYEDVDYFIKKNLLDCLKHQNELITYIEPYLNKWTFKRLNCVIQAILIVTLSDYFYDKETNKSILINSAVKLAKKYADDTKDYKYVNAILDNALKENGN